MFQVRHKHKFSGENVKCYNVMNLVKVVFVYICVV